MRRLRLTIGFLVLWAIAPMLPLIGLRVTSPVNPAFRWPWFLPAMLVGAGVTIGAFARFAWLGWRAPKHLRARGLTAREASRMAREAPLSQVAFWTRPAVAALLHPDVAPAPSDSTRAAASESRVDTKTLQRR